jgi:hypothetical protein
MRTSTTNDIGGKISSPIRRIEAASIWYAANDKDWAEYRREYALHSLIHRAEDIDADALVTSNSKLASAWMKLE